MGFCLYIYFVFCVSVCSVSEALKQLSVVETLSRSVSLLKCSLERLIHNSKSTNSRMKQTDKQMLTFIRLSASVSDGCCPVGWDRFSSSCYFFSKLSLKWNDSRAWCDKHESHLVILTTDEDWVSLFMVYFKNDILLSFTPITNEKLVKSEISSWF